MILIGGPSVSVESLPMQDIMEYQVESMQTIQKKLKFAIKKPDCFKVYLHCSLCDIPSIINIVNDYPDKVVYYQNEEELIYKLENEGSGESEDVFSVKEEVEEPINTEVPTVFETEKTEDIDVVLKLEPFSDKEEVLVDELKEDSLEVITTKETPSSIIVEKDKFEKVVTPEITEVKPKTSAEEDFEIVDTELPDALLQIPNISEDTDSLKVQLENKQKLLEQKNSMIKELKIQIEDNYKVQETQISEIKEIYEDKIAEANRIIEDLSAKAKALEFDADTLNFLRFRTFSQNCKIAARDVFTDEEKSVIGRLHSKVSILASGAGDSIYSMCAQVNHLISKNPNIVIVDFLNDSWLPSKYKIKIPKTNMGSMTLLKNPNDLTSLVHMIGDVRYIPTPQYNDISLLSMDWAQILRTLDDFAGGKPIVFLFNNVNNFNIRYTVSKLATQGNLYVFTKCNPLNLTCTFVDLKFIPTERATLVALDYIKTVEGILNLMGKERAVITVDGAVDWKKIGVL